MGKGFTTQELNEERHRLYEIVKKQQPGSWEAQRTTIRIKAIDDYLYAIWRKTLPGQINI